MRNLVITITAAAALTLGGCARTGDTPANTAAVSDTAAPTVVTRAGAIGEAFSLYDLGSTWKDQRGETVPLGQLAGKVRVVSLVYTSCHATCPAILVELKRIEESIPADRRDDVGFVLVSLDPARDTPGRLATWAEGNQLDPVRWTLLNGSEAAVRELAAILDVRYQQLPDGEVAHANVITVLDTSGTVVHQQVTLGDETRGTSAAVHRLLE